MLTSLALEPLKAPVVVKGLLKCIVGKTAKYVEAKQCQSDFLSIDCVPGLLHTSPYFTDIIRIPYHGPNTNPISYLQIESSKYFRTTVKA